MPAIVAKSIAILSDAGLGMAMFSLGEGDLRILLVLEWMQGCFFNSILTCRFVYGSAAQDHCLWQIRGCVVHGSPVSHGACGHGCCLHRSWSSRRSLAHCNCSGMSNFVSIMWFSLIPRLNFDKFNLTMFL